MWKPGHGDRQLNGLARPRKRYIAPQVRRWLRARVRERRASLSRLFVDLTPAVLNLNGFGGVAVDGEVKLQAHGVGAGIDHGPVVFVQAKVGIAGVVRQRVDFGVECAEGGG